MLTREEALALIRLHVSKENNVKHMIAVGAIMRVLAVRLGEDSARWERVGLLHDIDFEECHGADDHTLIAAQILAGKVDDEIIETIKAHNNEHTGVAVDTKLKKGLVAADAASGLIIASALVMPSKKLADVRPESLVRKYGAKDFAKGASRPRMAMCESLGLQLTEFLTLALDGMKSVAPELGL
ncbi:MAG: HDIG domain-containing metalloprotein [Methanomassiliicoccales archaeon]|jgi:putative nucleotidyltransferase with HDIG domain